MSENENKQKTTCDKKEYTPILPPPPAATVAELVGVSTDYVKKINNGDRAGNSRKGKLVKFCNELIVDGQRELMQAVKEVMTNQTTEA